MKERIITITMSIDEYTHEGTITPLVTENGETKTLFKHTEMASTLHAIHVAYNMLATQFIAQLGVCDGLWTEEELAKEE